MLGRMGRDAGSLLGVEITSDTVRMLQLQRRRGRQRIIAWAQEPLAVRFSGDWSSDVEPLLAALRQAYRHSGARRRQVAVALSAAQVICKLCQVPADLPEGEREARLLDDAQRLFPFPLNDLALDFQVLGVSATAPEALDVLVGAYRQSLLEPMLHRFEEAGLEVAAVEIDSLALRRVMPSTGPRVLLQVENERLVVHGWRNEPLAWRRESRVETDSSVSERVAAVERLVAAELRPMLPEGVLVAGSAGCPSLVEALQRQLEVRCSRLGPPDELDLGGEEQALAQSFGDMALSVGLALGGSR